MTGRRRAPVKEGGALAAGGAQGGAQRLRQQRGRAQHQVQAAVQQRAKQRQHLPHNGAPLPPFNDWAAKPGSARQAALIPAMQMSSS